MSAVVVTLSAGLALVAPPASAADPDRLAFACRAPADVCTVAGDGSDLRRLLGDATFDSVPTWSPDGQQIAFLRSGSGLTVMNADGTGLRSVVADEPGHISWSPDGTRLAYDKYPDVYVVGVDGTGRTRLTDDSDDAVGGGFWPAWSPDGSTIAYASHRDGYGCQDAGDPTLFLGYDRVYLMAPDGSGKRAVTEAQDPRQGYIDGFFAPSWAPDGAGGAGLAYMRTRQHVSRDSSGQYVCGASDPDEVFVDGVSRVEGAYPSVSPDGSRLAFYRADDDGVYVAARDGSGAVRVATGGFPVFRQRVGPPCRVEVPVSPAPGGGPVVVSADLPGGRVTVTLSGVRGSGTFVFDACAPTPDDAIFALYDLHDEGFAFTSAEVCVPYDEQAAADRGIAEDDIDLLHTLPDGTRKVITTSRDTVANVVCGVTTSFSPFEVAAGAVQRTVDAACPADRVPDAGFSDVVDGSTHDRGIDCLVWWRIARGTSPTTYSPDRGVTRAQMATFLAGVVRSSSTPLPVADRDYFTDDTGDVHEADINDLAAAGVVAGTAPGTYEPLATVTRAQMATFLVRTLTLVTGSAPETDIDFFLDDDGSNHEANIDRVAAVGITAGSGGVSQYAPAAPVTRAQMATFLARTLDLLVTGGHASPPA